MNVAIEMMATISHGERLPAADRFGFQSPPPGPAI